MRSPIGVFVKQRQEVTVDKKNGFKPLIELTSMTAEYFLVQDRSHRETVEAICERFPQLYVVPSFTCKKKIPKILTTKRNALNVKLVQANATISNSIEFPAIQICLLTLVVKSINTINTRTLVISTKEKEVLGVLDFIS